MTRWIGGAIVALLLLSFFLLATFTGLIASEVGTRWLLHRAVGLSPVPIELVGVTGRLLTAIHVDRIVVIADAARVQADDVTFDPDWAGSFFDDRVVAKTLSIGTLGITTKPSGAPPAERVVVLPAMPMDIVIERLEVGRITFDDIDAELMPSIAGAASWTDVELRVTGMRVDAARYSVQGDAVATLAAPMTLEAELGVGVTLLQESGPVDYTGKVALSGPLAALNVNGNLETPWQVAITGRVEPLHVEPLVALEFAGKDIAWRDYRVASVQASIEGTRVAYAGQLVAQVETPYRVVGTISGPFQGDLNSLRSDELTIVSNAGRSKGPLALEWSPELALDFRARVSEATPGLWVEGLDGTLGGEVEGRFHDGSFSLGLTGVTGTLEGQAIEASGSLVYADDTLSANEVVVTSGPDRLTGSGRWRQADDFSAAVDFELTRLGLFVPGLAGNAKGVMNVERAGAAWSGSVQGSSETLVYDGNELHDVAIVAERRSATHNRLTLTAASASRGTATVDTLAVTADGPDERLGVLARWHAAPGNSEIHATVQLRAEGADIVLADSTELALPGGAWRLAEETKLRVAAENVEAGPHCWRMSDASLCVQTLRWKGESIESAGSLTGLPLSAFGWIDPVLDGFSGDIEGEWSINKRGTDWRGAARLGVQPLHFDPSQDEGDEIALPGVRASATLDERGVVATVSAGPSEKPVLTGAFNASGFDAASTLSGRLEFSFDDLAMFSTFTHRMTQSSGKLAGHLELGGTLGAPTSTGEVILTDGAVEWQEPYIELTEMNIRLELVEQDRVTIAGTAQARDGKMVLKGDVQDVLSEDRHLHLALTSETVTVEMPDMEIAVTPELELDWSRDAARLTGLVRVPRAKIKVSRLPEGATAVSVDVVVVGREEVVAHTTRLATDLRVLLGDEVYLTAFGLETRLTGSLRLRQPESGVVSLTGRIDLKGGEYSAYGRSLAIESGRLIFQGPPDDPDVDIRAVRRIQRPEPDRTIVVGVHVRGRASALQSTLFSDPAMAESDTLSYLVMGRPLQQTTESEGEDLSGVAVALGLAQATGIVNQIRTRVGLDELGAGTSVEQETTVIAGKQLGQKLYARYTYNTFTRLSALLLRYDLSRRLSLEATAGEAPGMDLIYRVGSDR